MSGWEVGFLVATTVAGAAFVVTLLLLYWRWRYGFTFRLGEDWS